MEDAWLLAGNSDALVDELDCAKERLMKHRKLEAERIDAGLETDMARWEKGGTVTD